MKNIIISSIFLLLSIALCSCNKKDNKKTTMNNGTVTALLNGKAWKGSEVTAHRMYPDSSLNTIEISAKYPTDEKGIIKMLSISAIKATEGKQKIFSTYLLQPDGTFTPRLLDSCRAKYYSDNDAPDDQYEVLEGEGFNNYINIEHYDSVTKKVMGTFQVTLIFRYGNRFDGLSDTLQFTNGRFDIEITKPIPLTRK